MFAKDSLVYSNTLQEWVTHNGIDIKAEKTTVVKAAAEGEVVQSAYKYDNYGNKWVDMRIVARDMDMDISELVDKVARRGVIEQKDSTYSNFLQVVEFVLPGDISPYEYNKEKIGNILLSKRKQELINVLHKEIFNDAMSGKKIKFVENEDN